MRRLAFLRVRGRLHPQTTGPPASQKGNHAMETQTSPANLLGEIGRIIEQFRLPGLDAAAILEARRKDIDALAEANRIALAGAQDLAHKQGEILQKTLREIQTLVRDGSVASSLTHSPAQLGNLLQNTVHETLGNMRDLAELACKSQTEAFNTVSHRVHHNIEELRALLLRKS